MTKAARISTAVFVVLICAIPALSQYQVSTLSWSPQLNLLGTANLPGSFLTGQSVYADNERIFASSYQGDLFILERNRDEGFPLIQTIHLETPLSAVTGDSNNVYVSGRDGNLYVFSKTWPVQPVGSMPLSQEGLASVGLSGNHLYVATGQASMAVSNNNIYLSELNRGDFGLEVTNMQSYGTQFSTGATLVFDRNTLEFRGAIPNPPGQVNINTWQNFMYLTVPGCCGAGITIYDANTLKNIQAIGRPTNTAVGIARRGDALLVGGSESGSVDMYAFDGKEYKLVSTADLPALTGFDQPEDIEIRALWVDGLDNLVIAASSWGDDQSRGPLLPSLFFLEINAATCRSERPGVISRPSSCTF